MAKWVQWACPGEGGQVLLTYLLQLLHGYETFELKKLKEKNGQNINTVLKDKRVVISGKER